MKKRTRLSRAARETLARCKAQNVQRAQDAMDFQQRQRQGKTRREQLLTAGLIVRKESK